MTRYSPVTKAARRSRALDVSASHHRDVAWPMPPSPAHHIRNVAPSRTTQGSLAAASEVLSAVQTSPSAGPTTLPFDPAAFLIARAVPDA